MKLLVDIGNSRVKWGLAERGTLEGPWALPGRATDTAFESAWGALRPEQVVACSRVDRTAIDALRDWVRRCWGLELHEFRTGPDGTGLVSGYGEPAELGADRWANLHGARALLGAVDTVIVDAGTAVTVDALRADGRHLGGAILAGLAAGREALGRAAPGLPVVAGAEVTLPARATREAIVGGTVVGLAGAIEQVATAVGAELKRPRRLLTGGDGPAVQPYLLRRWRYDAALTLRGLAATTEESACVRSP